MGQTTWAEVKTERMADPEAATGYELARAAFEFGARVRERREAQGLSQSELARRMRTSQSAIARLEAGGAQPRLQTICALAMALGVHWTIGHDGIAFTANTGATSEG